MPLGRRRRQDWATWGLLGCQALYYATVSVDLTLTALVGLRLAPSPALATLPLALMTLVGAVCAVLAGLVAGRVGYTPVMIGGAVVGAVGAAVCAWAVAGGGFWMLCTGTALVGTYRATGGYIRLMGADLASADRRDRAMSLILAGGLIAAIAGPWLATSTMNLFGSLYTGSYLVVAVLSLASVPILAAIVPVERHSRTQRTGDAREVRPPAPIRLRDVERPRDFTTALATLAVAGTVMTLVMAIGPLESAHASYPPAASAAVIQWHMVGMFAPSLFSGLLLERWGRRVIALLGTLILARGGIIGASGESFVQLLLALGLNGLGWNFLFVAGTSYLVSCYPPGRGGRLQAIAEGVGSATAVVVSFAAGAAFLTLGWQGSNTIAVILPCALLLWLAKPRGDRWPDRGGDIAADRQRAGEPSADSGKP
ncbi:MFS transporter [Microbacterium mangrovi]|uniref:MFS transporter n=1 Tax=Microbacterium mangrovi TaxID=1348253 RepID=UPI00068EE445|nr:MFS transporter [Microbacterium mangrovi]